MPAPTFATRTTTIDFALALRTPADFAVVARKAAALGENDRSRLAKWLEEEADMSRRHIGF